MNGQSPGLYQQIFLTLFGACVGGFISGGIGFWFFFHKRRRDAKDSFLVKISKLRGDCHKRQVWHEFYTKTKPELKDAIFTLRPFLNNPNARKLAMIWERYDAVIPYNDLKQSNENEWIRNAQRDFAEFYGQELNLPRQPSEIILRYLDSFESVAK